MKQILTSLAIFIIFITLISATTVSVMSTKPAKAKITLVKSFRSEEDSDNVAEYIKSNIKKGYQLKLVEGCKDNNFRSTWIVVMEKY